MAEGDREYKGGHIRLTQSGEVGVLVQDRIIAKSVDPSDWKSQEVSLTWDDLSQKQQDDATALMESLLETAKAKVTRLAAAVKV